MIYSTIESDVAWLSIVEKITSNGYVYAELWPNPNYPNLDFLVNALYEVGLLPKGADYYIIQTLLIRPIVWGDLFDVGELRVMAFRTRAPHGRTEP